MTAASEASRLEIRDLGRVPYAEALALQEGLRSRAGREVGRFRRQCGKVDYAARSMAEFARH